MRRTSGIWASRALAVVTICVATTTAHAQGIEAQQRVAALALFEQASQLMDQRRFDEACPKIEEVIKLQPAGVGAKLTLAECYEAGGKLASAWGAYLTAEAAALNAGQAERSVRARKRAAELAPRLARITVVVSEPMQGVPGLEIHRDGLPVRAAQWGLPLPVDRGSHVVTAVAPGKEPWSARVEVTADGQSSSVSVPALRDVVVAVAPPLPAVAPPSATSPAPARAPAPVASSTTTASPSNPPSSRAPAWPWVSGGVGLVFIGVAVGAGVDGLGAMGTLRDSCGPDLACPASFTEKDALNARKNRDLGLTIGFGAVGIAAVSAALIGVAGASTSNAVTPARATLEVVPMASAHAGGALFTGEF
jgi:hypothetical protein